MGSLKSPCMTSYRLSKETVAPNMEQEAQLLQTDRATLRVIEYFATSLNVSQAHSK